MPFRRSVFLSSSEDRLQKLIEQRLTAGADKAAVDQRIWDLFGEEWCMMVTDLAGFSRGVAEFGITHFLQTIFESERLLVPIVEHNDGMMLKMEGDSFLIIFRNVHKALVAAVQMQQRLREYNADKAPEEHVLLCMGLGFGQVLRIGDADVWGTEVNAAYFLGEDTASAYEILVTQAVRDSAGDSGDIQFEPVVTEDIPPGCGGAYRVVYDQRDP